MGYHLFQPLFPLGKLLISPGVEALGIDLLQLLRRYQSGDWGDACAEDRAANQSAIHNCEAILSDYPVTTFDGTVYISIMTEADRSFTVLFLVGESIEGHQE